MEWRKDGSRRQSQSAAIHPDCLLLCDVTADASTETGVCATMIYCVGTFVSKPFSSGIRPIVTPWRLNQVVLDLQDQRQTYFFAPITASLAALATRNLMTVFAGI